MCPTHNLNFHRYIWLFTMNWTVIYVFTNFSGMTAGSHCYLIQVLTGTELLSANAHLALVEAGRSGWTWSSCCRCPAELEVSAADVRLNLCCGFAEERSWLLWLCVCERMNNDIEYEDLLREPHVLCTQHAAEQEKLSPRDERSRMNTRARGARREGLLNSSPQRQPIAAHARCTALKDTHCMRPLSDKNH